MAIITISRELAALGDETAHELAKQLGFCFVDRLKLEERIKSYGVDNLLLEKYDEKKPGFIASISQDRDDYLHFLKLAMFEEASGAGKGCVFIGRGAFSVFANIPGTVSAFLVTSKDIRVERVRSYFHCDEKKAQSIVEQSDRDRIGFHRCFFEADWKEPANYRITLNTGTLHPSVCASIIAQAASAAVSTEAQAAHGEALAGALLAQRVVHHIVYEKGIRIHFLEVGATAAGEVTLFGVTNSKALIEEAARAAEEVDGVKKAAQSIQIVEEYAIIH